MQESPTRGSSQSPSLKPIFPTVDDSPMFRHKVAELEEGVDRLRDRSQKLIKGAKHYRDGVAGLVDSTAKFADHMVIFCGGTDEESMSVGGALISRFISVFRELGSFHEVLKTQMDILLCERFQADWAKMTGDAKEVKKKLDKKMSEYEHARLKHLGHRVVKSWLKETSEEPYSDMVSAQAAADETRFEVARKLTEIETRKRYDFLEAMISAMDAHLKYFKHGYELLKSLEEYLQHSLQMVDKLKEEEALQNTALEDIIYSYKEAKSAREVMLADVESSTPSTADKGPVQLRPGAMKEEMEAYISDTMRSNGSRVTVLKQGYLLKKSTNLRKEWNRRFFVLDSQGMLYYYSNKEKKDNKKIPQNTVNLLTSTIKQDAEDATLKYCFRVVSPEKTYTLQAEDELDKKEWMEALQSVIAVLLNGNHHHHHHVDGSRGSTPSRPTHSRGGSTGYEDVAFYQDDMASAAAMRTRDPGPEGVEHHTPDLQRADTRDSQFSLVSGSNINPLFGTVSGTGITGLISKMNSMERANTRRAAHDTSPNGGPAVVPPLQLLRSVGGNRHCSDCGASDPDWASLNMGVLLCIECSGLHRNLGVHISKVRSLTLDVNVWTPSVLEMFRRIGNEFANTVWEENLKEVSSQGDAWVWCEDSEEEESTSPVGPRGDGLRRGGGISSTAEVHIPTPMKPKANDPLSVKERFISWKYVEKKFVVVQFAAGKMAREVLWKGVTGGELRQVVRGVVAGADVNAPYSSSMACLAAQETHERALTHYQAGPQASQVPSRAEPEASKLSAMHVAAKVGDIPIVEYLYLNGSRLELQDLYGRTPLHYALLHNNIEVAKLMLRKKPELNIADCLGVTALHLIHEGPAKVELLPLVPSSPGANS